MDERERQERGQASAKVIQYWQVGHTESGMVLVNLPGHGLFAFPKEAAIELSKEIMNSVRKVSS